METDYHHMSSDLPQWERVLHSAEEPEGHRGGTKVSGLYPRLQATPRFYLIAVEKIGRRPGMKTTSQTGNGGLGQYKVSPCYAFSQFFSTAAI